MTFEVSTDLESRKTKGAKSIDYEVPDLSGLEKRFGADVVEGWAQRGFKVAIAPSIRTMLSEKKPLNEIVKHCETWTPGKGGGKRLSPKERAERAYGKMSDLDKQEMMAKLQAELGTKAKKK